MQWELELDISVYSFASDLSGYRRNMMFHHLSSWALPRKSSGEAEEGVAANWDMDTWQVSDFIKCPLVTESGIVEQGD